MGKQVKPLCKSISLQNKSKGQSRIDNPGTSAIVDTRHRTTTKKTKVKTHKIIKISNTDPSTKAWVNLDVAYSK
jgi:hypothetical protein